MIRSLLRAFVPGFFLAVIGVGESSAQGSGEPALRLSPPTITLSEGGPPATYEVSLSVPPSPAADVTVALSLVGAHPRQISFEPESFVFTPANWNVGQSATVRAPGGTGAPPPTAVEVLHTASGAQFGDVAASLHVRVIEPLPPLPAVPGLSVTSLPDGFEVSWTPIGFADGYLVEYVLPTERFHEPGSPADRHAFVLPGKRSYRVSGLPPGSAYKVRVTAFEGSRTSPVFGAPALAPRFAIVGGGGEVDRAFSESAEAASALVARGLGSSALEAVAARVATDREPAAHAAATAPASWSLVFAGLGLSDGVLSVHERSHRKRAEDRERGDGPTRPGPSSGPVQRGDWSGWVRTDIPGLGGRSGALTLDGSAQVVHLGIERALEPSGFLDRSSTVTGTDGEWLVGAGLGLASASVDIGPASASLDNSTWLLYPYLGYRDKRKAAYASIGGGLGTSAFRHPSFQSEAADQKHLLVFAGLGGEAVVAGRSDRVELVVRGSALGTLANTDAGPVLLASTVGAHRLRLGVEARHARRLGGGILVPSGGVGVLHDGGHSPRGVALEADAGARFDWRRFSFSARTRTLLHSSGGLDRTLGISGAVRFSPGRLGRGLFLTVSPSCGAGPGDGSPWDRVLGSSDPDTSLLRLSTEAGYAFSAASAPGLVTVTAAVRSGPDTAFDVARAGVRYQDRGSFALGIDLGHAGGSGGRAPFPAVSLHAHLSF